jgi:hypothetical protein
MLSLIPSRNGILSISDPKESANGPKDIDNEGENEFGCNSVQPSNCYKIGYYVVIPAKENQKGTAAFWTFVLILR